jgi:dTDP-glucose pyrophosphorylase
MKDIQHLTLSPGAPLREAMRVLDATRVQIVLIVDADGHLVGTCTDGDIRRALLRDCTLDEPISSAMNNKPLTAVDSERTADIHSRMRLRGIRQMPIISQQGQLLDLLMLTDPRAEIAQEVPVVLIVGGLGKRLRPLTDECPKPMLEIGGRPILERIIEKFVDQGFHNFVLSVGYLGHIIEEYFGSGSRHNVNISYIREKQRMGTGGALSMLPSQTSGPIIVMNGDLITEIDFRVLLEKHTNNHACATMCTREHSTTIPFGVVETNEDRYVSTREKPILTHRINAGVYCLSDEAYRSVPKDQFYDMPTLFSDLMKDGKSCRVHPVEGLWLDIGTVHEFKRAQRVFTES